MSYVRTSVLTSYPKSTSHGGYQNHLENNLPKQEYLLLFTLSYVKTAFCTISIKHSTQGLIQCVFLDSLLRVFSSPANM